MKPLDHRNKVIREFWEAEPEDVKAAIAAYREHRFLYGASSDEEDSEGSNQEEDSDWEEDDEAEGASAAGKRRQRKSKPPLDPVEAKAKNYNEYVF